MALDLGLDTGTAEGEMVSKLRMAMAAYERRLISLRMREALAQRKPGR